MPVDYSCGFSSTSLIKFLLFINNIQLRPVNLPIAWYKDERYHVGCSLTLSLTAA